MRFKEGREGMDGYPGPSQLSSPGQECHRIKVAGPAAGPSEDSGSLLHVPGHAQALQQPLFSLPHPPLLHLTVLALQGVDTARLRAETTVQ